MRTSQSLSRVVAIVAALTWFAGSNHCAFATVRVRPTCAAHSQCHHSAASADEAEMVCCKTVPAIVTKIDNIAAKHESVIHTRALPWLSALLPNESSTFPRTYFDNGPPLSASFAESVLQRSLFAHAPPFWLS